MKQFRLIKTYPGSPPINTIIEEAFENSILYKCIKPPVYLAKENVENYPKYWEKVEKVFKNYEILSFRCIAKGTPGFGELLNLQKDGNYNWKYPQFTVFSLKSVLSAVNDGHQEVYSVKRLSDGQIFTIGDVVKGSYTPFIITGFIIRNNEVIASSKEGRFHCHVLGNNVGKTIEHTIKPETKKPIFTTEDGVDIFEGDTYHYVYNDKDHNNSKIYTNTIKCKELWLNANVILRFKRFSTKEKAQEYLDSLKSKVIQKEYKVHSYLYGNMIIKNPKDCANPEKCRINSIERLSDGQIFTISDKIIYSQGRESIKSFEIALNSIRFNFEDGRGILLKYFSKSIEIIKQKPVKQETVPTSTYNTIVSFGPNPNTGGIYTYNKHTGQYHSDISKAEIPYSQCFKYPVRSVFNTDRSLFKLGDCVSRLDTKSNTKFDIIYFKTVKKEKIIYAYISKQEERSRLIKISIDNLEHYI